MQKNDTAERKNRQGPPVRSILQPGDPEMGLYICNLISHFRFKNAVLNLQMISHFERINCYCFPIFQTEGTYMQIAYYWQSVFLLISNARYLPFGLSPLHDEYFG